MQVCSLHLLHTAVKKHTNCFNVESALFKSKILKAYKTRLYQLQKMENYHILGYLISQRNMQLVHSSISFFIAWVVDPWHFYSLSLAIDCRLAEIRDFLQDGKINIFFVSPKLLCKRNCTSGIMHHKNSRLRHLWNLNKILQLMYPYLWTLLALEILFFEIQSKTFKYFYQWFFTSVWINRSFLIW